jgi:hypothetical protein
MNPRLIRADCPNKAYPFQVRYAKLPPPASAAESHPHHPLAFAHDSHPHSGHTGRQNNRIAGKGNGRGQCDRTRTAELTTKFPFKDTYTGYE